MNALINLIPELDRRQVASFLDVVVPRSGLVDGKKIEDFVRRHARYSRIEDLPIPFAVLATGLATGEEVVFREGDLIEAVRASISLPGILTPVRRGDSYLIDGGLVNPVPVRLVREMGADYVIAVDLSEGVVLHRGYKGGLNAKPTKESAFTRRLRARSEKMIDKYSILDQLGEKIESIEILRGIGRKGKTKNSVPSITEVLVSSLAIVQNRVAHACLEAHPPDLLIQPHLEHIRLHEFHRDREAIDAGYREVMTTLIELPPEVTRQTQST